MGSLFNNSEGLGGRLRRNKRAAESVRSEGEGDGMKEAARWALDTAQVRGASYVDVRAVYIRQRYLSTKNGVPSQVRESESLGLGIRVLANGAWGFAATDDLTRPNVDRTAAQAVEIARASALAKKKDVELATESKIIDRWESRCRS